jgi:hypothetical protein
VSSRGFVIPTESVTRAVDRIVDVDCLLLLTRPAHLVCPFAACAPLAIARDTSLESLNYAGTVLQSMNRFGDDISRKRRGCVRNCVNRVFDHFLENVEKNNRVVFKTFSSRLMISHAPAVRGAITK